MFGSFGGTEIILILAVLLLFFGAKRIPEMARGIGQGINEFRKTTDEITGSTKKDHGSTESPKESAEQRDK